MRNKAVLILMLSLMMVSGAVMAQAPAQPGAPAPGGSAPRRPGSGPRSGTSRPAAQPRPAAEPAPVPIPGPGSGTAPGTAPRTGTTPRATPAPAPAPAQPAAGAPAENRGIATEGNTIKINFPEMELEQVLKNFSAITGKNFVVDQMPKGQIRTIGSIGPVEIPKKYAYDYFVLIMGMNGYTIVSTSVPNVYKVVRTADAGREAGLPVVGPGGSVRANESMVTRFVPIKYVNATDLAGQLAPLTSKEGGQVVAYAPTNTLIIMDSAINIERMIKIIRLLDVPTAEPEMEIVKLKYMTAEEASQVLGQVYGGAAGGGGTRSASTRDVQRGRARPAGAPGMPVGQPGQPQPQMAAAAGGGESGSGVKIIPLERMNSLLIIAEPDQMKGIKELIAKIDVDVGMAMGINVYYVQHAEATELAGTLSGISGGSGGSRSSTRSSASSSSRSSSSSNRPDGMGGMAQMPVAAQPQPRATQAFAGGNVLEGMFGGDVVINSDDATNSLIIMASPQDYSLLLNVIKKLDIPRRQVFVEAVLLEVTYQDSQEAGISLHAASGLDQGGVVFGGTKMSDVSSMTLLGSLAGSGGSLALPSGITIGALGAPVEIPGTGGQVVIPSAGLIVRLLASDSAVNVLSTPTILTTDNQEASIEVGQKIPVPTGQSVGTGYSNISISRESVGIKLKITPQINESDNIRLDIFTEISGAVSSSLGIDVNSLGVTTSLKTAETTVIVKDSQTIVIGGLMEDRVNQSSTKIPFLGDIPVLGWLFKTASKGKNKTNLIILLTPHIVKSAEDVERVKAHIKANYNAIEEEALGDQAPDWNQFFDSQLRQGPAPGTGEVIDLRTGDPQVVPPPDWGWTPETTPAPGSTTPAPAPAAPSRSGSTGGR